ncbi:unnamed protein product [Cladocopium goreaui]|uniref:Probable inactive glycosyltransferase 25 family member 3 (Cerebral endothelial cell adhesion molecule) n=1 Tax=Cladocopium goreaui TaxID=2562237 RepID=A0A9P1BK92_9DINO|nr:unnamed protein product [Cladocopium goreaui]
MALVRRQRAYCLSLPQRPERFARAEAALKEALEPLIELEMFPGIYGNDFRHLLPDLDALEESLGCKLYRQWPICEVEDVLRMRPDLAELPEWKIWESYISWHKCWISDRASNYIDFYNRHLKLGEVAACVGHFRLWQKAMEDDVDLCLIFEDDARLAGRDAVEQILCEFQVLEEQNFNWDLIYLHSALYSKSEEPLVQPGLSRLCLAGHRKWAGAYALSRRGLEKLTKSGYDTCIFPVDDFLPALHSFHPRPDIRSLPCVDTDTTFVALTFPQEAALIQVEDRGSVSKFSTVILGDLGASIGEEEDLAALRMTLEEATKRELLVEDVSSNDGLAKAAAIMQKQGFVLVQLPECQEIFEAAEKLWQSFFLQEDKASYSGLEQPHCTDLPLADAGYTLQNAREHFHVVLGLAAQQRWPWDPSQATAPLMAALQGLCQRLLRELPKGDELEAAWQRETDLTGDASVFDIFHYFPMQQSEAGLAMAAHTDPGLFTAKFLSESCGLELLDVHGDWLAIEELRGASGSGHWVLVLAADLLERWTHGAVCSCRHRVRGPAQSAGRLSLVYDAWAWGLG